MSDLSLDRSEVEKPGKLESTVRSRFGTEDKSERGTPVEEYQRLLVWKVCQNVPETIYMEGIFSSLSKQLARKRM